MARSYQLDKYRNIGIIAHISAGKTTTTTCVLYYTGKIHKIGTLEKGTTPLDWMVQERERSMTIMAAATTTYWKIGDQEYQINIIDTPGHIDFTVEVQRSLKVLDGAITVFDGGEGVQTQSETVWHQASSFNVPRICFVNKMDKVGASLEMNLESIWRRLTKNALPIQIPIGAGENFSGVCDLIKMKALRFKGSEGENLIEEEIPESLMAEAKKWRDKLIEKVAEEDEIVLEKYLNGKEISVEELRGAIRKGVIKTRFFPVLFGSLFKRIGVQPLLDAVIYYLPSPADLPPVAGKDPKTGEKLLRKASDDEPFSALTFKIATDPFVGALTYFRVYSGRLAKGSYVLNASTGERERIGRIVQMHADDRTEMEEAVTGDILATVGLKNTSTGHTLCAEDAPIVLEKISFPAPVISIRVSPKTKADDEKMSLALKKLKEEDPTFTVRLDPETQETIISGMGELHLEIILDRLKREFKVETTMGRPQVAYRETIKESSEAEGKYIRQSGGHGQYGHVRIKIEPKERGEGFEFVDEIKGGIIPKQFIPAVEKGIKEAMDKGVVAHYPMMDLKCTLFDGSFHEVDSSEMAFKIAASMAFQDAAKKAKPVILEPIMKIEINVPKEFFGDVIADLSSRRGRIDESIEKETIKIIKGVVPLSEIFGYATTLRSLTEGRGTFSIEFSNYEEVPRNISQEIIDGKRK